MAELEAPRVILRGPAEGDSIILPMGLQQAHITAKGRPNRDRWTLGTRPGVAGSGLRQSPAHTR